MSLKYPNLFSPISIRGHVFKNRIISAPLGAWVFSPDNYIYDYAISMFEEKAKGGAAAVCVGHTEVHYKDDDSDGFGLYFDFRKKEGTCALTTFAQAIQQYGAHASVELNYGGIAGEHAGGPAQKVAYDFNGNEYPENHVKALTKEKMQEIIGNYVKCVEQMRNCGFHMVTIHGAHGWMPAMFMDPNKNKRTDEYGGCLENRMRYPLELMQAVRKAAGNKMIVEYRISGIDPDTDPASFAAEVEFVSRLKGLADIVHISAGGGTVSMMKTFPSYLSPRGVNRKLAKAIKAKTDIPIAVVGAISDPAMAEEIVANGEADFVAMCRTLIADPQWPIKARQGRDEDIRPCLACYNCLDQMHKTHFLGCDINPRCGMEHRVPELTRTNNPMNVVVVGGGPSGMVAAITAFDRGHTVTLIEKTATLGGLLRISDNNGTKWMLNNYKNYLVRQVEKRGIRVLLNTEATNAFVKDLHADAVLVASGSSPFVPPVPGIENDNVFTCTAAHDTPEKLGDRIVVVGGNMVGCEEALELARTGKQSVTILEMTDRVHADAGMVAASLDECLNEAGICILKNTKCTAIDEKGVLVESAEGKLRIDCDSILLAAGMRSNFSVYTDLLDSAPIVEPIGDCSSVATVRNATRSAFYVARNL